MTAVLTLTHDEMAIRAATQMRDLAVKGQTPWSNVFGTDIVITSSSDWPEPDYVFSDPSTRVRKEITKMMSLWGGGFRLLKRFGGSYYLKEFGLVPDWPKVNEIMTKQLW